MKEFTNYNVWIIVLFIFFEVLLFNTHASIQLIVTIFFYTFILISYCNSRKNGIMYFISFTLLALNMSNYLHEDSMPPSFYGLRCFGFSFNILFSFLFVSIDILRDIYNKKFKVNHSPIYKYISFFILYSTILGGILLVFGVNYLDNYKKDVLTYIPFFLYAYILSKLHKEDLLKMLKYLILATFLLTWMSLIFGKYRQYAVGEDVLLVNTMGSTFLIVVFFAKELFNKVFFYTMIISYSLLMTTGLVLIGGKTIIYVLIVFVWLLFAYRKLYFLIPVILFLIFNEVVFAFLIDFYEGSVIASKLAQVSFIFKFASDLNRLAIVPSSVGNLAGELLTLTDYSIKNVWVLIFGKGFGGGIPDNLGYLSYWAGNAGYSPIDLVRNDFHKMHLAAYEVFIKSGIVSFSVYIYIVVKSFLSRNIWGMIFMIFFLLMFSVSKEFILLTMFFYELLRKQNQVSFHKALR